MTSSQQRLPRFTRDPDAAGSFQFTKRDLEILRHVAEHRFVRSEWLVKLVSGSRQHLLRRLNLLYHHGYLERPRCQLDYYHQGGSKSLVYGLASRGAGRLRRDLDIPFHRMDWTTRNRAVGRLFIEHTLMVSDFMAMLELDCRQKSDVRLLYPHQLAKDRNSIRQHLRWTVALPGGRKVVVVPDKIFAIERTDIVKQTERIHYFLEADRGTMPIERRDPRQTCVMQKLKSYEAMFASHQHRAQFGIHSSRLLVVVRQEDRVKNIARAASRILRRRSSYFVIGANALQLSESLCDVIWQRGNHRFHFKSNRVF